MLGFLLQCPTILTLLMFALLVAMYVRFAQREEAEVGCLPRWRRTGERAA